MAEDDQVNGRLPDELAERLGQAPPSMVRPSHASRRKSLSPLPCDHHAVGHGRRAAGRMVQGLSPYMNLLPAEIIMAEEKEQQLLCTILEDVGRHAYAHLVKYLSARPGPLALVATIDDFIPPPPNQIPGDQMVMLSECLDDAVDSIRDIASHPGFKDTSMLMHASRETIPKELQEALTVEMITPEMGATALTLLTASAFRRPPTRMVESMMAASQEAQTNGADGDSQREGTEGTADDASVQTAPASDDGLLGLACSTGHDFLANVNHPHGLLCAAVKAGLWELAMLMVRVRQSGDFMGESECTPLMEACAAGHEKIVRQMIPYAEDLNTQSATQNTALIYASAAGHLDCVEVLLEAGETRGIDLDLKNENGHCALMEAAAGGHLEIVKRLIGAGSGSLRMNVNSEFKESPLTLASYKGHKELVMYLLTLDLGDTREEELHTALMEASMDGHIEVADILLKDGAPVNLPSDSFESPLTLAACGGHVDLVKLLLDAGANIEEPNDESYTPLMEAAREGHADVVRMLLDAGANVDATTEETGETAMTLAACGGFTEIVEMILEAGGDLELGANTPLMEAATEGHHHTAAGIIRMMKERKHDKDQAKLPTIQKNVSTALVQAADNGHYQITRELASSGFVDLNFQLENRTALMKAAKGGYRDIIRFLVQAGADVNLRSATADVTALSLACAGGHYDTVSELLLHHADPNVILKDGVTCVLEAARHGYVHIVELLLDYRGGNSGPKPNRKVATPRRQMAKRTTPASPAAKAVAAGAAAAAAAPAAKVVVDGAPSARPVRPMLLDSDSDSGSDYEVVASPAFPYHAHDGHEHVWEGTSCSRHAHLSSTAYWQQRQQNHHHHHHHHHQHHAHHHSSSSSHSAAAHAQHNAELHSALFGAYDGSCELPPLLQHQPQPAASPKVPTQLSPAGKLLYEELRAEQAAAAKVLRETGRPSEDTDAAALKTLLEISPEMQEKLFADLDAGAPGANFQNALVRTFLADETIVQRLAAGDTVSLNTKTGETSAGVYLPVAGVVEQVNRKVKGSLAAMRKAKKEAAAARAEARLTVADEDRLRAIEDDAVNAIRETFMVAKAQLTAAQTALDKKETAAQVVDAVRKAATEQIGSAFPSTLVPPSAFPSSMPPTSAFSSTMAPTSAFPSAMVPTTAFPSAKAAAAAAATPLPTKEQAAATINAAAAAAPKTKDPGAQASDMMKAMAQHLVMPQKDSVLDPSQVESFHKFHDFLVRTAKGDNPPASTMGGSAFSSKDGTPYEPASEGVMHTLSDELRGSLLLEQCDFDPSTVAILDRSLKAVAVAAASANPAAALARLHQPQQPPPKRTTGGGGGQTIAEIIAEDDARLSSLSPSPAPSSPALPMMTASSDEFVSDTRQPVTVRRRSASVPHNSSDGRWPFELTHKHDGCELAKRLAMQANNKQTGGGGTGGAGGDAGAPPPAKRATGANRQGGANARTGTVEKRPLAATSTFDVDMQTESNADTPLTLACSNGHTAMVELLITRGANVHHRDKKGFTPLILAATGGHLQIVQVLLDHGANIETTSERTKDTALSLACSGGKKEVAEMLLKRGANKEHRNVSDYTPLSLAASGGYVDICNMLLDAGAEINSRTGSKLGISPLMLAAMNGHRDATRVLLERGSDINAQIETNRNTALTLACFQGRTDVVRLLLQYHANVEHRAKTGLTPLMEAANGGYVEVGQLLLEHYADPNTSPVPSSRDTALTIAADKGHEKFVDLLLKNGAQVDARNKKGCTALWLACHGGHLETVQTLVKHKKTNVEMEDNRKVSPLMIAFRKGHTKIVKFLVKAVSQFPGDAELCRYIQTVTEQDLMTRCHECMNTIVTAKDKQAAQANLAADALIAQIEAEEEQARSKKLSKQRQKEKKKQKKQEKKKQEVVKEEDSLSECSEYNEDEEIDVVTVDEPKEKETTKGGKKKEAVMVKEESKKVEEAPKSAEKDKSKPAAAKAAAAATPLAAASAAKGKARAAAAAAVSAAAAAAAAAPAVEKTPEREPEKVEERIPGMSTQQPAAAAAAPAASVVSDEAAAAQRKTAADRRAASRRSVAGKNGPISTAVPTSTNALPSLMTTNIPPPPAAGAAAAAAAPTVVGRVPSPLQQLRSPPAVQQTVSMLSPLASPRGAAATQEEWVKANKKGRNTRNEKPGTGTGARSTSASDKQKLTDPTEENALAMWNNIEASRRRMTTLTVSSPCIARVIGRGGANINAIREATGASIEVERVDKALSRRDNVDREICIRGTAETVRNAVAMINGLIAETDVTVNEIIRLVRNSASPSEQARIAPDAYTKMATATATAGRGAAAATPGGGATTNVWQQRMAARQAQDAAARPTTAAAAAAAPAASAAYMAAAAAAVHAPPAPAAASQPATAPSPAPTARSDASSPVTTTPAAAATRAATPPKTEQQQPDTEPVETSAPAPPPSPPRPSEEEQRRKAPGFARPTTTASAVRPASPSDTTTTTEYHHPSVLTPDASPAKQQQQPHHDSAPASPAPTRPTALPSTPLHDRVPDLSQHVYASSGAPEPATERPAGSGSAPPSSAPALAKQDSASALFNDSTFRSIAEIWGDVSGDSGGDLNSSTRSGGGAFGGAWDNALLLNSFNSLNLSKPDWADYTSSSSVSALDHSSSSGGGGAYDAPSAHHAPSSLGGSGHNAYHEAASFEQLHLHQQAQQQTAAAAAARAAYGDDPFATNGPRSGPLFARGANAAAARSAVQQQPKPLQQQSSGLDSIFNNVAAALIHHQTGSTTASGGSSMTSTSSQAAVAAAAAAAAANYYPSPSYTDPAAIGLSIKAYANSAAANGVAAAYQLQQQQQQFARMQQQHAQLAAARANGAYSVPAPPPGFNQLNPVLPPPASLGSRSVASPAGYYGGQMGAPQAGSVPSVNAFQQYLNQPNWKQPQSGQSQQQAAPPTMNGTASGRNGAAPFGYSNGWN